MIRCSSCGKEVSAGAGHETAKYGFLCYNCYNALDMQLCSDCGQRFPRGDMAEHGGNYYCKDDYRNLMRRMESYKPKPEPKGPPLRGGTGSRIRSRAVKPKMPYESMSREIRTLTKPVQQIRSPAEQIKPIGKEREAPEARKSPAEEKAEMSSLLKDLQKGLSLGKKAEDDAFSQILNSLRDTLRGKKEQKP